MRLRMSVKTTESIILVTIGKINTKSSFLKTISPGNLKKCILGKAKKKRPRTIKITPKIIKNFATLCIATNS
jgi:hypothetical protein